ncbi:hypothetical protein D3C72_1299540 [compost metagenome]
MQRPEAKDSEFSAGTEGSFRRRPDMAAKAPTQMPGTVIVRSGPSAVGMQPAPAQPMMTPGALPAPLPQTVPAPEVVPSPEPSPSPLPISSGQPVPLQAAPLPLSSSQPVPVSPPPPAK